MTSFADAVVFTAQAPGTGSFVFGSPLPSWRTPEEANADGALIDGDTYSYFAVDDPTNPVQREWGHAVYTEATHTFTRMVLGGVDNEVDTGTSPINFATAPTVCLTILAEDLTGFTPPSGPGSTPANSNLDFYVATTGSDSNPGTALLPFATIQHAVHVAQQYDYQLLYFPTIHVAAGSYTENVQLPSLVSVNSISQPFHPPNSGFIVGDTTTPTNVVLNSGSGGICFTGVGDAYNYWMKSAQRRRSINSPM